MNDVKFKRGQKVSYKSKSPGGSNLSMTRVIGFHDVHENKFKLNKNYWKGGKNKRIIRTKGVKENRYVIAHYFGWYPHVQHDVKFNEDLYLSYDEKYYFAYESELTAI